MALVTSKGTMDKENSNVRKYIAQRAELLGAIRLPNDTFKGNAGTEVVSDILFLQKRDRLIDIEPDWVHLDTDENGIRMNSYFVQHPEMILGEMKMVSGRFGPEATCEPFENADLSELLNEAVSNIHGEISEYEVADELEEEDNSIPADPTVRNFSYTILDDKIYFRENSRMSPVEVSATAENRIKGMIGIRDCVRNLIELQTEDYPDSEIKQAQEKLNTLYDSFTKKYGLINSRANTSAFSDDSSYALLSALEVINEDGELERKADMFFKRTIKPHKPVTEVDTADEALAVSMGEKAAIDMEYMMELSGKSEEELFADLKGVIFLNPLYEYGNSYEPKYLMADEYLSGNVREKLATAKRSATLYPEDYTVNVQALEKVQPKDLTASEISVRLGATWIPPEIFQQFMFEFLDTPRYAQWNIKVHYSQFTGEWNIEGKSYDRSNVKAYSTYGTSRINAYKIIEETLNLKDVRIFDYIEDDEGKKKAVLNKKETAIAQAKQELIKQGFQDWIWADPARREKLTKMYNEKFNSIRPREYDGSHIVFNGMNPEIELREHQKNAVAHILYGGNTLLAHAVGAGKTFEMVAAAMESKRLGLCNKSLFVVPNHLTEQWAAEFLQLYPAANILVATKRDFETKNRKKFCGRIATGDYDAVIIGHSQFEKIPMSIERQRAILEQQLEELTDGIMDLKRNRGENFSIKQLEKSKKSVKQKLEKLNDQSRKDDVVTFEELGVDRLFIDESHYYKNLYLYTKMRNVGGIAQTEAQKSSDLFMKCRYLDELTGGRGTVFATGTPISNSMVELYTIQRYLQYKSFKFTDINFAVASREDKEAMFLEYSELLNSLDSGATTKLTINNRRLNRLDFEKTILIPETGDELDVYREEYNKMLLDKATGANAIVQDKYVTISINKKSVEDARTYFARVGADLIAHFARLGSKCVELETDERLRIVHDFFRVGEETAYHFNIKETRKKGHDFKDYVCPDTMEFEKDYFKMGNRYGRVLFLREYASYIKDSMVAELTDLNRNLMMSIDIVPVPTDEAVREAESRLLGVETNITNWQRKQNQNNNFSATVPYDMEQQKKEMKEFLDDLTTRDQRMMFAVLTMVHTADSKEQLDNDTEALLTTARKHLCQFAVLKYQQMDGLNTAMPFGTRKIDAFRTLTTESLAVFIPFRVQDIYHENGIYYGQNVISKNMIIADRRQLLNGNSFILGVSGGGKSFAAKGEIENIILSSNADVIIIDPEREYSQLVKALGGEIINISATSPSHINAMDMNKEYGDGANPVILKSEFIMSLCEQLIGGTNLGAKQKSIIDRCTASVYRDYQQRGYTGTVPTLQDFRAELLKQDEPEAKEIALAIELFTHGSLNTFAKPTNVDTDNRLICYDILDLGKQLMPIGMLVVLDSILNRITQNRAKGKQTFIFIDEIYLLFQHEYSANFLFTLWKRVRKYGAYATGITQNVDDLLHSHTARTMLANSEFLIMLNQASTDRIELAKLLNISDLQLSYITNVDAGHGLIKVGSSLVPFANKFPKNTKLYKLMTTKPGEGV